MKYLSYPEYKSVDVRELNTIPEHWIESKVKYIVDNLDKHRIPLSSEERGNRSGEYPYYGASGIIDHIDDYIFYQENILFGEDGANLLARSTPLAFIAEGKYWVNNHAHILRAKDGLNKFWVMTFENIDIAPVVSGSAQPKLTAEALGNLSIVFPKNYAEREQIATFLDRETKKIDRLIEKQQQLIKLLQEKRQAVIFHAVTKGLKPNVKMKDSGIEWLDEIPEHWEVRKIKCLFQIRKRISGELGYDVLSITQHGIKIKDIESGSGQLSMDYSKYQIVKVGDFAMNHMDLLTGWVDISKFEGVTSPDYRVFSLVDSQSDAEYYLYALQLGYNGKIFYAFGQGSSHLGRWRFPTENFKGFMFPYPPKEEQKAISDFIKLEHNKIGCLIEKCSVAIKLMKERRTALISAAVTGKIDVRNITMVNANKTIT
jgi:type I restriction enzyme S subunit